MKVSLSNIWPTFDTVRGLDSCVPLPYTEPMFESLKSSMAVSKRRNRLKAFERRNSDDVSGAYMRVLSDILIADGAVYSQPIASYRAALDGFGQLTSSAQSRKLERFVAMVAAGLRPARGVTAEFDVVSRRVLHVYADLGFRSDALALLLTLDFNETYISLTNARHGFSTAGFRAMMKARVSPQYFTAAVNYGVRDASVIVDGFVDDVPVDYLIAAMA